MSSLYAFDALARAARSLVHKRGITGDTKSGVGNAATFLLKMEGVLDGLFQDMVSLDNSEAKVSVGTCSSIQRGTLRLATRAICVFLATWLPMHSSRRIVTCSIA